MCRQRGRNPTSAFLETRNNEYVRLESTRNSVQLVLGNSQRGDTEPQVSVHRCKWDLQECMAFSFELKNKQYFPVVTGDEIGFEDQLKHEKKFFFRWGEKTGVWKSLQSVAEPNKYLSVKDSKVTIQSNPAHFRIHLKYEGDRRAYMTPPNSAYPNTRHSMCIPCQGRLTRRTVVANIMICGSESPFKRKTRASCKYISVKRQLGTIHNLNGTKKCHYFWANMDVKKV